MTPPRRTLQSNLGFRLMAAEFRIRDLLWPRRAILEEVGTRPGMRVLDYGCGPGSYVLPASQMVGETDREDPQAVRAEEVDKRDDDPLRLQYRPG
jgi:ubiquinone/menaquinone biosynthesis C-methylase UbiE